MRRTAAADADVADAERFGRSREVRHLEARAGVPVEPDRKGAADHPGSGKRLERRLVGRGPVRHGLCGDRARDRRADLAQQRQHRRRTARAVEPHDVGSGGLEPHAGLGNRYLSVVVAVSNAANVTTLGKPASRITSVAISASPR